MVKILIVLGVEQVSQPCGLAADPTWAPDDRSYRPLLLSLLRLLPPTYYYTYTTPSLSINILTEVMSLEPPTYLSSLQNNIRARPIPWEGAVRAGSITDDHLKKIKAVDKVRKEQRRQTVEGNVQGYIGLLAGGPESKSVLDSASRRTDIVQYILVLAADLMAGLSRGSRWATSC